MTASIEKRRVLDLVFAGYSLSVARDRCGFAPSNGSIAGGYRWLFNSTIRQITRDRLANGERLPPRAMKAYQDLTSNLTPEQQREIKAHCAALADTLIQSLSA